MEFVIPVKQQLLMEWDVSFNQYGIVFIISKLKDWAEKKIENDKDYYFMTNGKFFEELPSGTNERNIVRNIKKLVDKEIIEKEIIKGRTFYRLSDDIGSKIYDESPKEISKKGANNSDSSQKEECELFSKFWFIFPRKASKREALEEFETLTSEQKDHAIHGAKLYAQEHQETEKKFIKLAKNWLNEAMYEDYDYQKEQVKQESKSRDKISTLVEKIRQVLGKYRREKGTQEATIKGQLDQIQLKKGGDLFTTDEKAMLIEFDYTIENYDDIEFQDGEIEINIRGYFG